MKTKIAGLGNCYGSLHVKLKDGEYFAKVYCEVSKREWIPISEELYSLLVNLND
jgi:hypothetical protein